MKMNKTNTLSYILHEVCPWLQYWLCPWTRPGWQVPGAVDVRGSWRTWRAPLHPKWPTLDTEHSSPTIVNILRYLGNTQTTTRIRVSVWGCESQEGNGKEVLSRIRRAFARPVSRPRRSWTSPCCPPHPLDNVAI